MTNDIKYIGVKDLDIDLFEGQFIVPEGMTYNSYVILDEKICVLDTVDKNFKDEWLNNLEKALDGKNPDYLVIHHMEPDHSANIKVFMDKYQECKIVSSIGAFNMMKNLFGTDFAERKIIVKDGDVLNLGKHSLSFITAPFVHWPEVIFSYDSKEKILFSADAFGKFGSRLDTEDWACEARRYYFGIVGKFGQNVANVFKKIANFDIRKIYPLHGPCLEKDISYYLNLYKIWSSYKPEKDGVTICYSSVYGNTKEAAAYLFNKLKEYNSECSLFDLARSDQAEALEDAFKYSKLVLATTTYNGDIFPCMKEFINHLIDHNYQNRTVALIENGLWAPLANKSMEAMLNNLKNITIIKKITIKGQVTNQIKSDLDELAKTFND